jgi:hypothetical protein
VRIYGQALVQNFRIGKWGKEYKKEKLQQDIVCYTTTFITKEQCCGAASFIYGFSDNVDAIRLHPDT